MTSMTRLASRCRCFALLLFASALAASSIAKPAAAQTPLAYWDFNDNELPGGGFGYLNGVFPLNASQGSGTLIVGGGLFEDTIVNSNSDTVYQWIQSFGGTTVNAQPGILAGGSISPQGGTGNENNGGYFQFAFTMTGLTDLNISYATQRTSTGFTTQTWSWSTDGSTFTDFQTVSSIPSGFGSAGGNPTFSGPAGLDDAATAFLRVTFSGATNSTGNNRLDNITLSAVPEPSTLMLGAAGLVCGAWGMLRRRKRA